jgi:hypothetical protein
VSASVSSQSLIRLLLPRPCSCVAVSQIKSPIELKSDEGAIRFELKEVLAAISSDSPSHHLFSSYPLSMCWSCRKFHLPGTCTKTGSMPSATPHGQEKATRNQICALLLIEDVPGFSKLLAPCIRKTYVSTTTSTLGCMNPCTTTRRPDCTGSTAPMSCIRTRRLATRLLVGRSHWLS